MTMTLYLEPVEEPSFFGQFYRHTTGALARYGGQEAGGIFCASWTGVRCE